MATVSRFPNPSTLKAPLRYTAQHSLVIHTGLTAHLREGMNLVSEVRVVSRVRRSRVPWTIRTNPSSSPVFVSDETCLRIRYLLLTGNLLRFPRNSRPCTEYYCYSIHFNRAAARGCGDSATSDVSCLASGSLVRMVPALGPWLID